jgi:hypothetical protein
MTIDGVWIDWIGFIDHLHASLGTTRNYSSIAISTIPKSPQHPLSHFQLAVSSPAVPWQQLLTVKILQLHALRSSCHSRTCRTLANCQLNYGAISSQPLLQISAELKQKQKQRLTAGNQPARSHRASDPAGTHGHIFVQRQDLCFFLSLILLIDKGEVANSTWGYSICLHYNHFARTE